jgi:hypothetical protein
VSGITERDSDYFLAPSGTRVLMRIGRRYFSELFPEGCEKSDVTRRPFSRCADRMLRKRLCYQENG